MEQRYKARFVYNVIKGWAGLAPYDVFDNLGIQSQILYYLYLNPGPKMISDISENISYLGISSVKLGAILGQIKDQTVKTEKNGKSCFELADSYRLKMAAADSIKYYNAGEYFDALYEMDYADRAVNVDNIKTQKEELLKYLEQIIRMENIIYSYSSRYRVLIRLRSDLLKEEIGKIDIIHKELDIKIKSLQKEISKLKKSIGTEFTYIEKDLVEFPVRPVKPVLDVSKPSEPEYLKYNIFNKAKITAQNEELRQEFEKKNAEYEALLKKHEDDMKEYEVKLAEYEIEREKAETLNAELNEKERTKQAEEYEGIVEENRRKFEELENELEQLRHDGVNSMLAEYDEHNKRLAVEEEIILLEQLAQKAIAARNDLYSLGVIYSKYRNFVAVTSFYDYFMAGRCTSFEGADGAYNLFEQESRMDVVISKLENIEKSLEKIKANQYCLYQEMKKSNDTLEKINDQLLIHTSLLNDGVSKLAKIESNTGDMVALLGEIADNTEVSAYYSKKNAELTDALGYMVAFK